MGPVSDQGYTAAYCGHYPQIILSFSNFYGHLMSSGSHFKMAAAYNYLQFQFEDLIRILKKGCSLVMEMSPVTFITYKHNNFLF